MNKLIEFSLKFRLLIIIALALITGLGIYSMTKLPIDAFPDVTNNQVQIITSAPSMAIPELESLVTYPIEVEMRGIPGVEEVRSLTKFGISMITIVFYDDVDIYFARSLVFEKLSMAKEKLPQGVNPTLGPVTTGLGEVYQYVLESKTSSHSSMELRTLQDWLIRPVIRTVPGVADVVSFGGLEKQYQVLVNSDSLLANNVSINDVAQALEKNNANVGGNFIEEGQEQFIVRGVGQIKTIDDILNIIVKYRNEVPIYIKNIADVKIGGALRQGGVTMNGKGEIVTGTVQMIKGANSRDVVNAVKLKVETLQKALPKGVVLRPFYDRTELIEKVIYTVTKNLLEGGALVIVILLLFLGNFIGAIIVALVIPLSMLFSFIGMNTMGLSANLMTLGAIDFGMIVDGSIVVIENIIRRLSNSKDDSQMKEIIFQATKEIAKPVTFGVIIIILVYLPILSLTGLERKMFTPMALTVGFALIGSLILALTFVPVAASLLLRMKHIKHGDNFVVGKLKAFYRPILKFAVKKPLIPLSGGILLLIISLSLATRLGSEFLPTLDEGSIALQVFRIPSISLTESLKINEKVEKVVKSFPEVLDVVSKTGRPDVATDPMGVEISDVIISLKNREEWKTIKNKDELVDKMREELEKISGVAVSFSQPIALRVDELISGVKSQIAVKIFGEDKEILKQYAQKVQSALSKVKGVTDLNVEQTTGLGNLEINVKRNAISQYGMNVSDVLDIVEIAIGGKEVTEVIEGQKRFDLTVRLNPENELKLDNIRNLLVSTPQGQNIPLSEVADIEIKEGPAQSSREDGQSRIVIECNVNGRDIGSFVSDAKVIIDKEVQLPTGYYLTWGGQFENQERAFKRLMIIVPVSLVMIFIVLFSTFNSLSQALMIILNIPFALIGGIFSLWIRGIPLSVSAAIGFIALFGVAVLNGIVMVEYINHLRDEGHDTESAVIQGAEMRLRPVLMTALVASLGFIPMAFSTGVGSEVQRPLATVVIGGLITSTILTLVILPAIYKWFDRKQDKPIELINIDENNFEKA